MGRILNLGKMPTFEQIRELCLRVTEAKESEEFQAALLLLANALELFSASKDKNGAKSAAAS